MNNIRFYLMALLVIATFSATAQTSDSLSVETGKKIKLEGTTLKAPMGKDTLKVKMGGAFRFNWRYMDCNEANKKQGSAILYDMARINMGVNYGKIQAAAEYRFYAQSCGGGILKYGWIGYNFNEKNQVRFGLSTVPFGILPYQSNSYFFNINYYIGLEDDDDMGITYQYAGEHWQFNAGFFKNLAGNSVLCRFPGFNKARNTGINILITLSMTCQKDFFTLCNKYDNTRLNTREKDIFAGRTDSCSKQGMFIKFLTAEVTEFCRNAPV